jgi:hypothetical protein
MVCPQLAVSYDARVFASGDSFLLVSMGESLRIQWHPEQAKASKGP